MGIVDISDSSPSGLQGPRLGAGVDLPWGGRQGPGEKLVPMNSFAVGFTVGSVL